MKINKNKTIILVLLIILFIILGLITYYFLILSDVVVKQEEDISLIKNYITEESDVFESDELDVDYSLLTIEEKKDLIAEQEKVNPNIRASLVYDNLGYQVYAFNNSIQGLDLNFDEANDVIIKSRIYGADYYDSLENEERVVYSFYIDRWDHPKDNKFFSSEYLNIITKEISKEKIGNFDRDFIVRELFMPECNAGEILRIVLSEKGDTLLVIVRMENKDDFKNFVNYELYKLERTGNLTDSDYIFSYVDTVRSRYASCDLEQFANIDIVTAVKEAGF